MGSPSYRLMYPAAAYLLSLLGGVLIVLYGFLEVVAGIVYQSAIESIVPGGSTLVIALGAVGVVSGLIIVFLGVRLKTRPTSARTTGVLIIVLSLISFVGGGGFLFVGLILGLVGGILAVAWKPSAFPPAYGPPGYGTRSSSPITAPPWAPSASPPLPPGAPQRFCSSCGSPNVATAQFCAKCGTPMS